MSSRTSIAVLAALLSLSCEGQVTEATGRPGEGRPRPVVDCDMVETTPGRAPMRRLTVTEYDHTVRDLFGDTSQPADRLIDNERGVESADGRIISALLAEQYMYAAEDIAARLTAPEALDETLGCDRAVEGEGVCARQFIERVAPLVYRHPLDTEEIDELYALYDAGREDVGGGFVVGIQLVIEAMLQSPDFLYRVEIVPTDGEPIVRLDGHQLAARLSYFLWSSTPDPLLRAAAARGDLDTDAGVEAQARRMLADPKAEDTIQRFFASYLDLAQLHGLTKDPALFPDFDSGVAALMRQETEAFVRAVVIEGDGSWETLLTADWSMMNRELAEYYGLSGPTGDTFERVPLDGAYHAGFLTHGSLMASRARAYETSPIHRGLFVRGGLICGDVPDVPENLDTTPPPVDPTLTTRERLGQHRADPYCASCHRQIDPLGFAFEHFDAAGRFRADENGLPIDASGDIVDSDIDGTVDGAPELARRIVGSDDGQACFTDRWVVQAYGRAQEESDECAQVGVRSRFVESGFDVRELIVALALSEPFTHRVADQDSLLEGAP